MIADRDGSTLDRMMRAVEKVRERLLRMATALDASYVQHTVAGGNAVAAWVGSVDDAAVRNTPNVDVLIRRDDLGRAREAAEEAGFIYRVTSGFAMLIDGPGGRERQGVHILFADEKFRDDALLPNPGVDESEVVGDIRVVSLGALVRMKLTAFRTIDRVHIDDMIDVGLIDETWCERYPPPLGERLRELIATPGG